MRFLPESMTILGGALVAAGCAKAGPAPGEAPSAEAPSASARPGPRAAAAAEPPMTEPGEKPKPDEWKTAAVVSVGGAIGLGCETRFLRGWLRVLCRSKNGTGGKPVKIEPEGTPDPRASLSEEGGERTLILPFVSATKWAGKFHWTDTRQRLELEWPAGKARPPSVGTFRWDADAAVNKTCADLAKEWRDAIEKAKTSGPEASRLSAAASARLPRNVGQCHPAGLAAWALAGSGIARVDCGGTECVKATFEVQRVTEDGKRLPGPSETVTFEPGRMRVTSPTLYDWNGDGSVDAFLRWDSDPAPGATAGEGKLPTFVWTIADGKVAPYPGLTGIVVDRTTHADGDARPDLVFQGPYMARLPKQCGLPSCPPRLVGPGFIAHAADGGKFDTGDSVAIDAAKKACPSAPADVVTTAGTGVDLGRTARAVACARMHGKTAAEIDKQLTAAKAKLCVPDKGPCAAFDALSRWAKATPPLDLR
jgi:hypothetical protein